MARLQNKFQVDLLSKYLRAGCREWSFLYFSSKFIFTFLQSDILSNMIRSFRKLNVHSSFLWKTYLSLGLTCVLQYFKPLPSSCIYVITFSRSAMLKTWSVYLDTSLCFHHLDGRHSCHFALRTCSNITKSLLSPAPAVAMGSLLLRLFKNMSFLRLVGSINQPTQYMIIILVNVTSAFEISFSGELLPL